MALRGRFKASLGGLIASLTVIVVWGLSCLAFLPPLAVQHASRNWPTTTGRIVSKDGPSQLEYQVNGKWFTNYNGPYVGMVFGLEGSRSTHHAGDVVEISYHPASPGLSTIHPGLSPEMFVVPFLVYASNHKAGGGGEAAPGGQLVRMHHHLGKAIQVAARPRAFHVDAQQA